MGPQPTLRCPCGEKNLREILRYDAPPTGEIEFSFPGEYQRSYNCCEICGHYFSCHDIDMKSLYESDYLSATYGGIEGVVEAFRRISTLPSERSDNHHRIERVSKFADQWLEGGEIDKRLIDIGSGLGVFVFGMKSLGWQCTALDPDERFSQHARQNTGVDTLTCDFTLATFDNVGRFQCIALNKVLEHVEDPVGFLLKAKELLGDTGFIYVEVPDGEMASHDGGEREEFFVDHHHVFSSVSLSNMTVRAGLALQQLGRLREPSGKFTLFAFLTAVSS